MANQEDKRDKMFLVDIPNRQTPCFRVAKHDIEVQDEQILEGTEDVNRYIVEPRCTSDREGSRRIFRASHHHG